MKLNLKQRLILSFCSLIVVCVALIIIFSNILLDNQFREYVINKQTEKSNEIVNDIDNQYISDSGWNYSAVENIGVNALSDGIILKLYSNEESTIWDATEHNNGMCTQMIEHMAQNTLSRHPNFNGGYEEKEFNIIRDNNVVGVLKLGYYGPFYYNDIDLAFINSLNKLFFIVAAICILFAVFFAIILARNIVEPITKVIDKTKLVSGGVYHGQVEYNGNIKEISELVNAVNSLTKKLESQETLRKKLTSDMAHELRTPLTSIQGHLEAMIDKVWEPTDERLESCYEEILRINRMVKDIEKLAKLESENINLNIEETDLSKLMKNILNNFEKQILDKKIKLDYDAKSVKAYVDKDKISQVFINIISNAIKYTNENGIIDVKIFEEENNVCIKIKDNGIGIDKKHLPYIFERLYRADESRCRNTGGSGIGLTIAKKLVELHKGTIQIQSEFNVGTEVIIILNKNINIVN